MKKLLNTLYVGTFGLVAYLVIAFEYLLYLVFGDALSRVGHGHFDVLRDEMCIRDRVGLPIATSGCRFLKMNWR